MHCPVCRHETRAPARFCEACGTRLTLGGDAPLQDAERRHLAVLFADLVGSTALGQRLDPEDLRNLLTTYHEAVRTAAEARGGRIAMRLGDGAVVYFGFPVATEDYVERAVRGGLDVVAAIQALRPHTSKRYGVELAVRVGVHVGEAVVGPLGPSGADIAGDVPNVASRIQALAPPNAVVIGTATSRLVAGMFRLEPLGSHQVPGVGQPLDLFRVVSPSGVRSRLDLDAERLTPFVGRDDEVTALLDRWGETQAEGGRTVLVAGEAGVGKSRLVQVLRARLTDVPHTWLECTAARDTQDSAFQPVIELQAAGMGFAPGDSPEQKVAKLEAALTRVDMSIADVLPLFARLHSLPVPARYAPALPLTGGGESMGMSADAIRRKSMDAMREWLLRMGRQQPVVLLVEDLHWLDPSTLALLDAIVPNLPGTRVLLLLTHRPEFVPPWRTGSAVWAITLCGLGRSEASVLIRRAAGPSALPPDWIEEIVRRADGIPLFLEEMTRVVLEVDTTSHTADTVATPPLEVPTTLRGLLMARLDQLGPAKEVAQIGAVIGRDFSGTLLRAVWTGDEESLREALGHLTAIGLVHRLAETDDDTYVFKHALVQEAAYTSLLHASRRQYHERIALALESRGGPGASDFLPEPLAYHFTEAGHYARAVPYWFQAGQRSTERSAHVEAIRGLTRGLECVGRLADGEERRVLELGLRTLLGANLLAVRGYTAPEVSANCASSLALLAGVEESSQVRPVVWALWLHHLVLSDRDTTRELAAQFHSAAERDDDAEAQCRAHTTNAITTYWQGEFERTRQHAAEGRARYRPEMRLAVPHYGDHSGPYGYIYEAMSLWFQGRPDQARLWIEKGLAVAREANYAFTIAAALSFATQLEQLCRDAAATEALAERTITYCQEQGFPLYLAAALAHRGWARATRGNVAQGLEDLVAGVGLYRMTGAVLNVNYLLALLAEVHLLAGDRTQGLAAIDEGLALAAKHLDTYFVAELHRIRGALLLLEPADPDAAEAALRQALAVARAQGAAELELRSAVGLGRLLGERGRAAEARALLAAHVARGHEAGHRPDLLDAQAVLAALG
jgi:class 3 adenylate cyclase/predicted ATPase